MTIIKKGIEPTSSAARLEQALDVSREVAVTTHSAYMMPYFGVVRYGRNLDS